MNRNRAFTLIELLVVIAIIAILAAILFPVFAQAKIAAKKASSISNIKQLALGVIMYQGDVDDMFPKNHYLDEGVTIVSLKTGDAIVSPDRPWTYVIQPYVKNYPIIRDPGNLVDPIGAWSGAPGGTGWYYNWDRWPGYGFNTTFLNPAPGCNPWGSTTANPGYEDFGPPIVATQVNRPSNTVLFTTNKVVGSSAGAYLSIDAEAPGGLYSTDSCDWSNGGWGSGSYGDSVGLYPGNPTYTGTFSLPYAVGGNVGWCDGSVKYQKPGALAAGTNWQIGATNLQVWITNTSTYQWDYQGGQ